MRPLYLERDGTVVQADGPALRVRCDGSADRWFPLRQVSQVVSAERVAWTTPALLACAELGITVSFTDGDGAVLARLIGRHGERTELRQMLADFLDRADWQPLYQHWLDGMERMAMRSVLRRSGVKWCETLTPRALRQMFQHEADVIRAAEAFERIGGVVHGLLVALCTQALRDCGVTSEFEARLTPAQDLASILFWDFQLVRLAWIEDRLRSERAGVPPQAEIVAFFELRRSRTERLLRGLLNRLHRMLIEVDEWPITKHNAA